MTTPIPANTLSGPARLPAGYQHSLSQPAITLSFAIQNPGTGQDLTLLDMNLQAIFGVDKLHLPDAGRFRDRDRMAAEMAWRILLLGAALLRAVKVPAFDPGKVLAVAADEGGASFRLTLAIPVVENISMSIAGKAYERSARTLQQLLHAISRGASCTAIAEQVNEEFVAPVQCLVGGGRSTIPLLRAAHRAGIPFIHLADGVYQLGWGSNSVVLDRSSVSADSAIGARLSNNKFSAAEILRTAGLPAPMHSLADTEDKAWAVAQQLGMPVVIKPVDRDRGEGITVGVQDRKTLAEAFALARGYSGNVLVEHQVKGVCHRMYVFQGRLLFAVKRLPKSVTGDGTHTVAELIDIANAQELAKAPWARLKPFPTDAMAVANLAAAGLGLGSIPAQGQYAPLRKIQSNAWGGVVEEVTARLHPDNIDIAVRAARKFGLVSAGIDLISPDVSVPWHSNGAIINEVNYSPLLTDEAVAGRYIPTMIAGTVKGDGRIPVEVFVGGNEAFAQAAIRQGELVAQGVQCCLTSHAMTLEPSGRERISASRSLQQRSRALLLDRDVGALLLVVQTDELATTGLPVDRIDRLVMVDDHLHAMGGAGQPVRAEALRRLLYAYSL